MNPYRKPALDDAAEEALAGAQRAHLYYQLKQYEADTAAAGRASAVAAALCSGLSTRDLAQHLGLSPETIRKMRGAAGTPGVDRRRDSLPGAGKLRAVDQLSGERPRKGWTAGEVVTYNGTTWRIVQAWTRSTGPDTPGLWTWILESTGTDAG